MPRTIDVTRCGSVESAIRKLKKLCDIASNRKAREEQYHVKPTTKRRLARLAAIKREARKLQKEQDLISSRKRRKRND